MKSFDVPIIYRSPLISAIKKYKKEADKLKKDFSPTLLDFGTIQFYLARHFGFCYGVENAIEIAFKTIEENKRKRIFLLSEMIHNPQVNADLKKNGVHFLYDTLGNELINIDTITNQDIVLIPAFGTTLEMEKKLKDKGIPIEKYDTTCPFVEKVWNRSEGIAKKGFSVVIHGKANHEETRATFSHSALNAPTLVINDMNEAILLSKIIKGEIKSAEFYELFKAQYSANFNIEKDLQKFGVVNQTTMLAEDTQAIADFLKQAVIEKYGIEKIKEHFADTRDTLCYATNDNQTALNEMLKTQADLAIVVGGYNSSNTLHLVELCNEKLPTFFINSEEKILDSNNILHYNFHTNTQIETNNFLPQNNPTKILITSGASCPDALVEGIIKKLLKFFEPNKKLQFYLDKYQSL